MTTQDKKVGDATSPAAPFIVRILTDAFIGAILRNATDKTKAANTIIAVAQGALQVNAGNVSAGIAAAQAAVASGIADPALADMAEAAIAYVGTKAAAFQALLAGGTLADEAIVALANAAANQAITLAQSYLPPPPPAPEQQQPQQKAA